MALTVPGWTMMSAWLTHWDTVRTTTWKSWNGKTHHWFPNCGLRPVWLGGIWDTMREALVKWIHERKYSRPAKLSTVFIMKIAAVKSLCKSVDVPIKTVPLHLSCHQTLVMRTLSAIESIFKALKSSLAVFNTCKYICSSFFGFILDIWEIGQGSLQPFSSAICGGPKRKLWGSMDSHFHTGSYLAAVILGWTFQKVIQHRESGSPTTPIVWLFGTVP